MLRAHEFQLPPEPERIQDWADEAEALESYMEELENALRKIRHNASVVDVHKYDVFKNNLVAFCNQVLARKDT